MPSLDNSHTPPVIVLTGPTATGKTALSIQLARHYHCEILSADSRLVYTGLDIGTAKPTLTERDGIPHHLIDVALPTHTFTAAEYAQLATTIIEHAQQQGKPIIITGGTGFYLQQILFKEQLPSVPPNATYREHLNQRISDEGLDSLYQELVTKDPVRAQQLYPQDASRIIRALEIIEATGQPVPQIRPTTPKYPNTHWFGLRWDNTDNHRDLIAQRVDDMLTDGWLDEVAHLMATYGEDAHALTITHGYPELMAVINGKTPLEAAKRDISTQVAQYARRQRTWFKRQPQLQWLNVDTSPQTERLHHVLSLVG
jgi:tRNA dimethylallyltransferase